MSAAVTESTRSVYGHGWRRWERWCAGRGIPALPRPRPRSAPTSPNSPPRRRPAPSRLPAPPSPPPTAATATTTRSSPKPSARSAAASAARSAPHHARLSRPLSTAEIRQIVDHIDRTTAKGIRDAAIILLGFASALRRSELAGLALDRHRDQARGLLLHIRRSKTDPEGRGQVVGVAHGQHALTDPVAALAAWTASAARRPGRCSPACATSLTQSRSPGRPSPACSGTAPAPPAVARTDHRHSLRAGHATTAAAAGVALDRIAAPNPTQADLRPHRALHPPRPGTRRHLQPRPRALTIRANRLGEELPRLTIPADKSVARTSQTRPP